MIREWRALRLAAGWLFACLALGSVDCAAAQSAASGDHPPAAQNASNPAAGKSGGNAPASAPPEAKKPKVITNDDIKADRVRHNDGFAGGRNLRESAGNGDCDDECADQARELAGFGDDQEGEWRSALVAARRNLATDRAWPRAYATLAQAVKYSCAYQRQAQQSAVPSGNDYASRVERARHEQAVQDTARALQHNVDSANAQIERMAQQADEDGEPARAAIMRVLAQRVNDSCDP